MKKVLRGLGAIVILRRSESKERRCIPVVELPNALDLAEPLGGVALRRRHAFADNSLLKAVQKPPSVQNIHPFINGSNTTGKIDGRRNSTHSGEQRSAADFPGEFQ